MNHIKTNQRIVSIRKGMMYDCKDLLKKEIADNPLSKPEAAEKVYQFFRSGLKAGEMCGIYNISPSYFRELKTLNEKEWAVQLLTDDEHLNDFINEIGDIAINKGISEQDFDRLVPFLITVCVIRFKGYTKQDLIQTFDELYKLKDKPNT